MEFLGLASAIMAALALGAALTIMLRSSKVGSRSERALWVGIVFFVPIFGPLLYLAQRRSTY
jgi:hypothetical protein